MTAILANLYKLMEVVSCLKMKRKFRGEQEDHDDGWLSTRNKRKISPTDPHPRKRKSFSRPVRPTSNHGNLILTQNSPPPPQLITATKQTSIMNFFGNSTPSALADGDFVSPETELNIHDLEKSCYSNKETTLYPGSLNDDHEVESSGNLSSETETENCNIENLMDKNNYTDSEFFIHKDNLLEDHIRRKHHEYDHDVGKNQAKSPRSPAECNNAAEGSQQEINSSSSSSSPLSPSSSDVQESLNICSHLRTKLPLKDRTNFLDSVQVDFELNSMLPVSGCDSESFISQPSMTDLNYTCGYKITKKKNFDNDDCKTRTKYHFTKDEISTEFTQNLSYLHKNRKLLIDSEDADLELQDFSLDS